MYSPISCIRARHILSLHKQIKCKCQQCIILTVFIPTHQNQQHSYEKICIVHVRRQKLRQKIIQTFLTPSWLRRDNLWLFRLRFRKRLSSHCSVRVRDIAIIHALSTTHLSELTAGKKAGCHLRKLRSLHSTLQFSGFLCSYIRGECVN